MNLTALRNARREKAVADILAKLTENGMTEHLREWDEALRGAFANSFEEEDTQEQIFNSVDLMNLSRKNNIPLDEHRFIELKSGINIYNICYDYFPGMNELKVEVEKFTRLCTMKFIRTLSDCYHEQGYGDDLIALTAERLNDIAKKHAIYDERDVEELSRLKKLIQDVYARKYHPIEIYGTGRIKATFDLSHGNGDPQRLPDVPLDTPWAGNGDLPYPNRYLEVGVDGNAEKIYHLIHAVAKPVGDLEGNYPFVQGIILGVDDEGREFLNLLERCPRRSFGFDFIIRVPERTAGPDAMDAYYDMLQRVEQLRPQPAPNDCYPFNWDDENPEDGTEGTDNKSTSQQKNELHSRLGSKPRPSLNFIIMAILEHFRVDTPKSALPRLAAKHQRKLDDRIENVLQEWAMEVYQEEASAEECRAKGEESNQKDDANNE